MDYVDAGESAPAATLVLISDGSKPKTQSARSADSASFAHLPLAPPDAPVTLRCVVCHRNFQPVMA